jgi:hypothetical protein
VYIAVTREDAGVLIDGARLPNLPPSVASVLSRPTSRGLFTEVPWRSLLEEVVSTDFVVEGASRIELVVETP